VDCDFVLGSFFARGERYVSKEAPVKRKSRERGSTLTVVIA